MAVAVTEVVATEVVVEAAGTAAAKPAAVDWAGACSEVVEVSAVHRLVPQEGRAAAADSVVGREVSLAAVGWAGASPRAMVAGWLVVVGMARVGGAAVAVVGTVLATLEVVAREEAALAARTVEDGAAEARDVGMEAVVTAVEVTEAAAVARVRAGTGACSAIRDAMEASEDATAKEGAARGTVVTEVAW